MASGQTRTRVYKGDCVLRLYTFRISHFSEKARWALDFNGVRYEERALLPGAHVPLIRRRAARSTVPVLEHDGKFVQGSSDVLDYMERELGATKLAPPPSQAARAREIEELADRAFGRGTQRIFYAALLANRRDVVDLWTQDGPRWGRLFYGLTFPLLARGMKRIYKIREDKIVEAKDEFRRAMDETDRALGDRAYLTGDAPTRADVTVAALLAPACRPREHVFRWPDETPEELSEFLRELEGRPTWDFVLRMYREHRRGRA